MSRYNVRYKPGGAIAKPLEMAIKMQRATPSETTAAETPCCIMAPEGPFWVNQSSGGDYDPVNAIAYLMWNGDLAFPAGELFYVARLDGDLCGRDNDVVFDSVWSNLEGGPTDCPGPAVRTNGNMLIVTAAVDGVYVGECCPGILTVTATLDGELVGSPITLTFFMLEAS